MKNKITKDDLLFHSVHGLCRVAEITKPVRPAESCYSLLPVLSSRSKVRFTVSQDSLQTAGFSKLISVKEAHAILEYFKTGNKKTSACGPTWDLAVIIRSESRNKEPLKDKKTFQKISQSLKSVAGELAVVFQFSLAEAVESIQKNLGVGAKINPLVLIALTKIDGN